MLHFIFFSYDLPCFRVNLTVIDFQKVTLIELLYLLNSFEYHAGLDLLR
jgi:hypothetical protein